MRWVADKKPGGVTYGSWYKAEAEMSEYGAATYGMWTAFLSGDRVKITIKDGNSNGHDRMRLALLMMTLV